MEVMETSTCFPAYADRSASKSFQPPLLPVAAFQSPVEPCGAQSSAQ
jgi:hypothetical protein